jgi:ubiquitin
MPGVISEIIQKRKEAKSRTSAARRDYNRSLREEHGP